MASKLKTLDRIREVERDVQALKAQAEEERDRILREAKREALNLEEDLRNRAEAAFREILAAARERIGAKREEILTAGQREAGAVKEAARAHVEAAVRQLLRRFEEAVHVQA
ncbi:MAG: V-type ATP synthase subunit H [Thermoplasmata archaeon]